MNDSMIVMGGWAVGTSLLEPLFGSHAIYNDINRFMPLIVKNDKLVANWKEKLKDLVFFGRPESVTLVGWSTGAIAALAIAPLVKISRLILLSATPSFCRRDGFRFGKRPLVLTNMIESLRNNPKPVLQQFYKKCGFEEDLLHYEYYSSEELICGLHFLEQVSLFQIAPLQCPVSCLHGTDDKVIAIDAGKYLCEQIGGKWFQFKGPHAFFNKDCDILKIKDIIFP